MIDYELATHILLADSHDVAEARSCGGYCGDDTEPQASSTLFDASFDDGGSIAARNYMTRSVEAV